MKNSKLIIILIFVWAYSNGFSQTNKVKNINNDSRINFGISGSILNYNWFFDDENSTKYEFWKGTKRSKLYPDIDFIAYYNTNNKFYLLSKISLLQKSSISEGGIPYSFKYITLSCLYGYKFDHLKASDILISIGPFGGYIFEGQKGDFPILKNEYNNWDYGLELMINLVSKNPTIFKRKYLNTIKLQYGLNRIYYFKIFSISISLIGVFF